MAFTNKKKKKKTIILDKKCPNCKSKFNGIECYECGFDATEIDIY